MPTAPSAPTDGALLIVSEIPEGGRYDALTNLHCFSSTLRPVPSMKYAFTVELPFPFQVAVDRVIAALAAEKLGVVSDINVAAILKAKLGEDCGGYRILGACAPGLALRVIRSQPVAGALLPCNVVVRELTETRTAVDFMDPVPVLGLAGDAETDRVAAEARVILERVAAALAA